MIGYRRGALSHKAHIKSRNVSTKRRYKKGQYVEAILKILIEKIRTISYCKQLGLLSKDKLEHLLNRVKTYAILRIQRKVLDTDFSQLA